MPNSPFDVAFDEGWEAMLETATLVDVRSAGEIREEGAIEDTLHIPMSADWVTEATSQLHEREERGRLPVHRRHAERRPVRLNGPARKDPVPA